MLRILSLQSPSKIAQEHEIIAQLPPRPLSDPELLASMLESLLESAARDVEDAGRLDLSVLKKRPVGRGDSGGVGFITVGPRSALAVNSSSKYSEPRSAAKAADPVSEGRKNSARVNWIRVCSFAPLQVEVGVSGGPGYPGKRIQGPLGVVKRVTLGRL